MTTPLRPPRLLDQAAQATSQATAGGLVVAAGLSGGGQVRGTPQLFHQIDWADFLLACSSDGRFFALADAHVSGPETDLHLPVLAVNAARVGALMTLD